jgi:iron complex outermembrane receptor protein
MRGFYCAFPVAVVLAPGIPAAFADEPSTNTNVVASAGDAFGISLGPESIGLYGSGSVRGFSPTTAGNIRINGLYFDLQGSMIDRLATDTRIRVGLSATNFPWPAPSGIVDYTLREAKATPEITAIIYGGPYDSQDIDLDGSSEFSGGKFGIGAGIAYHNDQFNPGQTARTLSWGVLPTWHPNSRISISTFLGRQNATDAKSQATIYLREGESLPPISPRYRGPSWVNSDSYSEHYGLLVKAELSTQWSLRVGIFHSIFDTPRNYSDLYLDTTSNGFGDHYLVAEQNQHYGSNSGEVLLSYKIENTAWRQEIIFGGRGRSVNARYGGAEAFDFEMGPVEQPSFGPHPEYEFGPTTPNRIREYSFGTSYRLECINHLTLTAGLRRDTYSNEVVDPVGGSSTTSMEPWLYNANAVFLPIHSVAFFGSLTRGLEDSGTAPVNAINRGRVLQATRSSQEEVGMKYSPASSISLLAGIFDIDKSYFALDEHGEFGNLGQERHRGFEFSLTGQLTPGLRIVAGALLMSPEVQAKSVPGEIIGKLPIGQPRQMAQLSLDYSPLWLPSFSFDTIFTNIGSRVASVDNRIEVPSLSTLDLGAHYRLKLDRHSAALRIQLLNATNSLNWVVSNDGGLSRSPGRRAWAHLIVDL